MVKGWKNESRRHSLASKGIKTAQRLPSNVNAMLNKKTKNYIDPYKYQDNNQEKIIHSDWEKGNSYRYILEGTGDIFRELTKPKEYISNSYIEEKKRRIFNHFQDMKEKREFFPETGVHPEDSIQYAKANNKNKFDTMIKQWEEQPHKTEKQKIAIQLNISMIKGNYKEAKKLLKQI